MFVKALMGLLALFLFIMRNPFITQMKLSTGIFGESRRSVVYPNTLNNKRLQEGEVYLSICRTGKPDRVLVPHLFTCGTCSTLATRLVAVFLISSKLAQTTGANPLGPSRLCQTWKKGSPLSWLGTLWNKWFTVFFEELPSQKKFLSPSGLSQSNKQCAQSYVSEMW